MAARIAIHPSPLYCFLINMFPKLVLEPLYTITRRGHSFYVWPVALNSFPRFRFYCYYYDNTNRWTRRPLSQSATMTDQRQQQPQEKTYHKKATGQAVATVRKHSKECDLKLYASCFWYVPQRDRLFFLSFSTNHAHLHPNSPFVQRVWIALEVKGIPYQYIEVDPYKKPESLLEVNPRGLVPALRHGNWGCYESNVLLEYVSIPLPNLHWFIF